MVNLLEVQDGVDERRVALRGSSLGGFLALCAAAAAPEIAGVICDLPRERGPPRSWGSKRPVRHARR